MNFSDGGKVFTSEDVEGFRPQQGLTIMNRKRDIMKNYVRMGFRPLQGLPIMNYLLRWITNVSVLEFPSPTGVTYYECESKRYSIRES